MLLSMLLQRFNGFLHLNIHVMPDTLGLIVLNIREYQSLKPETTRNTRIVEQVGFIIHGSDTEYAMINIGHIRSGCQKRHRRFEFVLVFWRGFK